MSIKKHILVLPRWYPNKTDIQLGIFIQRQIELMKTDYDFTVIYAQAIAVTPTKEIFESHYTKNENINELIVYFEQSNSQNLLYRKLINFKRYNKAVKMAIDQMDSAPNLCHIHVPYRTAIAALKLKRKQAIPFVITEHWSGHLNGKYLKKNFVDKFIYKRILKNAKSISVVSTYLRDAFLKNTGFTATIIPNYIETNPINRKGNSSISTNILTIGDLTDSTKNITGLITAFKLAYQKNSKIVLQIIGGGPDEEAIKEFAKAQDLPPNTIQFLGRLPHHKVLEQLQNCDFYTSNARYETFGMTVAEALLAGKPVVATKSGGPNEFLNELNSIQIEPDTNQNQTTVIDLANALLKMSNDYNKYIPTDLAAPIEQNYGEIAVKKAWKSFYKD